MRATKRYIDFVHFLPGLQASTVSDGFVLSFFFFLFLTSFLLLASFFFLVLILFPAKGAEPNRRTGNISLVFLFSFLYLHGVAPGVSKFRLSDLIPL